MMGSPAELRDHSEANTAQHLRSVLQRLGENRSVLNARPKTEDGLLTTLIREIDEVILPREIALCSDGQVVGMIIASNRRLIELRTDGTSIRPSESDPDAIARCYARAIQLLEKKFGPVTLRCMGRSTQSATGNAACSARRLSEVSETLGQQNRLEAFLQMAQSSAAGWLCHQDVPGDLRQGGPAEIVSVLEQLSTRHRDVRAARQTLCQVDRSEPGCSAFMLTPEVAVIIAVEHKDTLLLAVPQSHVGSVMDGWQTLFARAARKRDH